MIKYHGRSFGVENLKDFFSVDTEQETENNADNVCEVSSQIFYDISQEPH
jgi:hypothetical protein